MFWLITNSGKWLTNINNLCIKANFISLFPQVIRTSLTALYKTKIIPATKALKTLFQNKKLPAIFRAFNPIYKSIRWSLTKITGILKPILLSKKFAIALGALTTASLLAYSGVGIPIIVAGTCIAALATYSQETRQRALARKEEKMKEKLEVLETLYNYDQRLTRYSIKATPGTLGQEGQEHSIEGKNISKHTTFHNVMGIVQTCLDMAIAGVAYGVASPWFLLTSATTAYSIYTEVKKRQNITSLREKLHEAKAKLQEKHPELQGQRLSLTRAQQLKKEAEERYKHLHQTRRLYDRVRDSQQQGFPPHRG